MYRSKDKNQNITHMNFVFDDVGIGDSIAALPALKYIYDNFVHVVMHIWVPDYFVDITVRSLPVNKSRVIIRSLIDNKKYNEKLPGRSFKLFNYVALGTHPTDTAYLNFINRQVSTEHKNYLPLDTSDQNITRFNLPEKYVCISTNYTVSVREFLPEKINEIVDFVKSIGYDVVFLGKNSTFNGLNYTIQGNTPIGIDFSKGIDLRDKCSLLETREIIKNAKVMVGLDNGLLHLAGTCDVPIVAGYTTVDPVTRMPYRRNELGWNCYPIVPPVSLECRFCQTNWNLTLGHDFRNCFYDDRKCVFELKTEDFINALKKIL